METIKRLSELDPCDVLVVERMFGRRVDATESFLLILCDENSGPVAEGHPVIAVQEGVTADTLPDWCDMYAGLSDAQIADLESVILQRADMTRSID